MSGIAFLTFCTVVALVLYQKASEWPEVTIVALVMFFGRIIERVWEMYFGKNRDYENQNKTPVK
jgi:hypothetical protein